MSADELATEREAGNALVGRAGELRHLAVALARTSAGRGELVVLTGESGAGKTALAEVAAEEADAQGTRVVWAAAHEAPDVPPYLLWTRLLRSALAAAPDGWPRWRGRLPALLPELAADGAHSAHGAQGVHGPHAGQGAPGVHGARAADAGAGAPGAQDVPAGLLGPGRFALFDDLRTALAELRAERPLLLVLEDLHAADEASLALVQLLAQELRALPLLLLGTYRPLAAKRRPTVDRALAAIAKEGRQLPVRGLGAAEIHPLLERAHGAAVPRTSARVVADVTGGNPGLAMALAQDAAPDVPAARADSLRIGDQTRAAVNTHVERLDPAASALLPPAAVLGGEVDVPHLKALVGMAVDELLEALGGLVAEGVLVEDRRHPGRYRFRRPVVRLVVLDELPPPERARLHLHAAAALEELHARDLEPHLTDLARHYLGASPEDPSRALSIAVSAARRADRMMELDQATELWGRALDFAQRRGVDRLERCDLLLAHGHALRRVGDLAAARAAFEQAAHVARMAGDDDRFARAALACGGRATTPTAGVVDTGLVELLTEASERCRDDAVRAALLGRLALERYHVDPIAARDQRTQEALRLAERSGDAAALANALHARHFALWDPDDVEDRARNAQAAVRSAEAAGDHELLLQAHAWCVEAALELGDADALDRHLVAHSRLADSTQHPYHRWLALVLRAMQALLQGRFAAAERHAQSAFELGARHEGSAPTALEPNARMFHAIQLLALRREQGRLADVEDGIGLFARSFPHLPVWRASLAMIRFGQGRTGEAQELLEHLAAGGFSNLPVDGNWFAATTALAEVISGLAEPHLAKELHELLAPYRRRVAVITLGASTRGPVAHFLGLLCATMGRHEEAVEHFRVALEISERLKARPHIARTRVALARSLQVLGGADDEVLALLRAAATSAVEMGLQEVAASAELALAAVPPVAHEPATAPGSAAGLVHQGDRWRVDFEGRVTRLRDAKGIRYLAVLLAEPGVEHPAVLLERAISGSAGRRAARSRFADLQAALADAEARGDADAALQARTAMADLAGELTGEGDDRAEQARVNVTRAIRTALRNIARADAALAAHLDASVRTGAACTYRPDPRAPIAWEVRADEDPSP